MEPKVFQILLVGEPGEQRLAAQKLFEEFGRGNDSKLEKADFWSR